MQLYKQAPGWAGYPLASSMAELWLVWCCSWAKAWGIAVTCVGRKEASMLCLLASWRRTLPATPSIRALRGLQAIKGLRAQSGQRQIGSVASVGASNVTHQCACLQAVSRHHMGSQTATNRQHSAARCHEWRMPGCSGRDITGYAGT